ncbi:MAG: hypothetical protein LBR16_07470 [Treponema sp.]|jgi:hypothetical protein|nr:hypothetical protein [Treponema sp.]
MKLTKRLQIQRGALAGFFAAGGLLLIHALGFVTTVYMFYTYGDNRLFNFYNAMQEVNALLFRNALIIILCGVLLALLEVQSKSAGPLTLALSAAAAAFAACLGVQSLRTLRAARALYGSLGSDFASLERYVREGWISYTPSTFAWDAGIALCVLLLCAALFLSVVVSVNAFAKDAPAGSQVAEGRSKNETAFKNLNAGQELPQEAAV